MADILSGAYWPVSTSRLRPAVFYTQLMIKVELIKIGAITSGGSIGYVGKIIIPDYSQRLLEINMARPIAVRP
ncbi:hypothetical protein SB759_40375, partial [Pseudomonas sp. SIMBA_059]